MALVHAVGDLGPWIMSDAWPLVAVFGMSGVETDLQAEGPIFRLLLEEIDRPVSENLGFVTHRSIGLFFEKRLPSDPFPHVPHESGGFACNADVFLAKVSGAIACRFENGKIRALAERRVQGARSNPIEMLAFIGTGEEAGPSHPTGGGRDEGVFKSHSLIGKPIDVGGFDNGMPGAS